ncbi:MAG TPA: hypothetical protein VIM61_02220 [Chthoniobacterales bacterium]|jgi:hypothetical protein
MSVRLWTEEEFERMLALFTAGWSIAEIAKALGRSENSVRWKLISKGYSSKTLSEPAPSALPPEEPEPDAVTLSEAERLVAERERRLETKREQKAAMEGVLEDRLVEVVRTTLQECVARAPIAPPPLVIDRAIDEPTSAVLLFGDAHFGKVCRPEETEGQAHYNPAVTLARIHELEGRVTRLLDGGPAIEELVVIFLGDILEGVLDHHAEKEDTILLAQQFALAIRALSQMLLRFPAPKIVVHGVAGNHGRWPNQRRMPTVGRESNFDRLVYTALESILEDTEHITFDLRDSSRQLIEIQNTLIQVSHGDQFRGGEYCVAGFKREAYHSALRHGPEGQIPELFVIGDKHISMQLPVGNGHFLVNGSLVGQDTYGQAFAPTLPSQTLFWIGAERGKFLQADIALSATRLPMPLPYDLTPPLEKLVLSYQ